MQRLRISTRLIVAELRANMVRVDADFSATLFKARIYNAERGSSLSPPHGGGGLSSAVVTWKLAWFHFACITAVRKARSHTMKSSRRFLPASKTGARNAPDLRRAFDKELRRIVRRASRDPGTEDVHAVRKGITRLRSWLRLVREEIGAAEFRAHNGRLRRAVRLLAPIRDARVMLAAFEALGVGARFPDTSKHLRKQSRRATKAAGAVMRQVKRQLEKELAASEHGFFKKIRTIDFAAALERMRGEVDTALAAARASGSVELLHTWRKRSKNYLHALAFLAGTKNRRHQATVRINRLLGEDHDLALLETELARHNDEPENWALLSIVAARREKLRRRFFPEPRFVPSGAASGGSIGSAN